MTNKEMKEIPENKLQELCMNFVGREIYCNMNEEVEFILKQSYESNDTPYSYDDIENMYNYRIDGLNTEGLNLSILTNEQLKKDIDDLTCEDEYSEDEKDTRLVEIDNVIDSTYVEDTENDRLIDEGTISNETFKRNHNQLMEIAERLEDYRNKVDSSESEPQEIFEFWAISDYLGRKLNAMGHPIITSSYGKTIWGRCTTGQAIAMDGSIRRIVKDIEKGIEQDKIKTD